MTAPREPVGRDADLDLLVAPFFPGTEAQRKVLELRRLAREARNERDALLAAVRGLLDAEFVARFDGAWERLEEQAKRMEKKP